MNTPDIIKNTNNIEGIEGLRKRKILQGNMGQNAYTNNPGIYLNNQRKKSMEMDF